MRGVARSTLASPPNTTDRGYQHPVDIFAHFLDQSTLPRITSSNLQYSTLPLLPMKATLPNFSMEGFFKTWW